MRTLPRDTGTHVARWHASRRALLTATSSRTFVDKLDREKLQQNMNKTQVSRLIMWDNLSLYFFNRIRQSGPTHNADRHFDMPLTTNQIRFLPSRLAMPLQNLKSRCLCSVFRL